MVKRGSVEDSGVERGQLLTEVEQLIQSQDCAIVSWGGGGRGVGAEVGRIHIFINIYTYIICMRNIIIVLFTTSYLPPSSG